MEWCKGCGVCVAVCPKQCLALTDGKAVIADLEACTGCKFCEIHCPDLAICVSCGKRKVSPK